MSKQTNYNSVGPILIVSDLARSVIAAIKKMNPEVDIQDQGSYIRVLVPHQCRVSRQAIEEQTGETFVLPDDLELIMPSFKGIFKTTADEALWTFEKVGEH